MLNASLCIANSKEAYTSGQLDFGAGSNQRGIRRKGAECQIQGDFWGQLRKVQLQNQGLRGPGAGWDVRYKMNWGESFGMRMEKTLSVLEPHTFMCG